MPIKNHPLLWLLFTLLLSSCSANKFRVDTDPLPSWNEGTSKQNILSFVAAVTDKSSADYVPPAKRIATFDNDGTLWTEQPSYFQLLFVIDRIKALAPQHPEWKTTQPYKAVLENDKKALLASGKKGLLELLMTTHAGNIKGCVIGFAALFGCIGFVAAKWPKRISIGANYPQG